MATDATPPASGGKIKYFILSDLHLGEADSVFTPGRGADSDGRADLFSAFSACLADLIHVFEQDDLPVMVLNGDILGLSFSNYPRALGIMELMVKAFTQDHKVCERVAYLPGNHDQHIWQLTKESHYQQALTERAGKGELPKMISVTGATWSDGLPSPFFRAFVDPAIELELKVFYPNFLIPPPAAGEPAILVHHGHFTETTYCAVSKAMQALYPELPAPSDLETLARENDPMIDFFFSELGRSGKAGSYFERLMSTLSSKKMLKEEKISLAKNLAAAVDYPYIPFTFLEEMLSSTLIQNIAETVRSERYKPGHVCTDETLNNLLYYLEHFCLPVLAKEGVVDPPLTFVWGHTHKPFVKSVTSERIGTIRVINEGGWVVPPQPVPVMGGSVVLVNEQNEALALKVFNDGEKGGEMHFTVRQNGETLSPFAERVMTYLYPDGKELHPLWRQFRDQLTGEIQARRDE